MIFISIAVLLFVLCHSFQQSFKTITPTYIPDATHYCFSSLTDGIVEDVHKNYKRCVHLNDVIAIEQLLCNDAIERELILSSLYQSFLSRRDINRAIEVLDIYTSYDSVNDENLLCMLVHIIVNVNKIHKISDKLRQIALYFLNQNYYDTIDDAIKVIVQKSKTGVDVNITTKQVNNSRVSSDHKLRILTYCIMTCRFNSLMRIIVEHNAYATTKHNRSSSQHTLDCITYRSAIYEDLHLLYDILRLNNSSYDVIDFIVNISDNEYIGITPSKEWKIVKQFLTNNLNKSTIISHIITEQFQLSDYIRIQAECSSRPSNVVVLGDGDLSFSLALMKSILPNINNTCNSICIHATTYDSKKELLSKYKNSNEIIEEITLCSIGNVYYNVDATDIKIPLPKSSNNTYIFNYPYSHGEQLGAQFDSTWLAKGRHKALIQSALLSITNHSACNSICLTFTSSQLKSWNVGDIIDQTGYSIERIYPFDYVHYSSRYGYSRKRGHTDGSFPIDATKYSSWSILIKPKVNVM